MAEPEVPAWTLSTDDGKVHRFRDLNTLHKWIVERKASRTDRLSRAGGPWLALGDMEELSSFFRVVDEADRARGPGRGAGSGPIARAPAARRSTGSASYGTTGRSPAGSAGTPPPVPFDARRTAAGDGPTVPNRRLPDLGSDAVTPTRPPRSTPGLGLPTTNAAQTAVMPTVTAAPSSPSSPIASAVPKPAAPSPSRSHQLPIERAPTPSTFSFNSAADETGTDADFLMPRHRGRNAAIVVVLLAGLGGGGAYVWQTREGRFPTTTPVAAEPPNADSKTAEKTPSVDAGRDTTASVAEAPPAAAKAPAAPPPAENAAVAVALKAAAKEPAVAKGPPPGAGHGKAVVSAQPTGHGAAAASARAGANGGEPAANSYDRLVTEGDRLLERGQAAKAEKLYTQALTAKPDGAGAMTGLAYVYLDRQRHFKAIETFRKVLASQPTYGPALFGIAESYRGRGDPTQALSAYRQYLVISPSGADAPAARRQIKDLESASSQAASNDHGASANGTNGMKKESPPPQDEE